MNKSITLFNNGLSVAPASKLNKPEIIKAFEELFTFASKCVDEDLSKAKLKKVEHSRRRYDETVTYRVCIPLENLVPCDKTEYHNCVIYDIHINMSIGRDADNNSVSFKRILLILGSEFKRTFKDIKEKDFRIDRVPMSELTDGDIMSVWFNEFVDAGNKEIKKAWGEAANKNIELNIDMPEVAAHVRELVDSYGTDLGVELKITSTQVKLTIGYWKSMPGGSTFCSVNLHYENDAWYFSYASDEDFGFIENLFGLESVDGDWYKILNLDSFVHAIMEEYVREKRVAQMFDACRAKLLCKEARPK